MMEEKNKKLQDLLDLQAVKDITTIPDEKKRARAEKIVITLAKDYIMNRESFVSGNDYKKAIEKAIAKF